MKKLLQRTVRALVLLLTAGAFGYYMWRHPELVTQLRHTQLHVLALLLLLYLAWFGAMGLTLHGTLRICGAPLGIGENILLNAYSTLVNFFVPGQGGVAVRGFYMKKRYQLALRHYFLATLIYYMNYAVVSAVMLLAFVRPWWQTALGILAVLAGSLFVVRMYERRAGVGTQGLRLTPGNLGFLLFATVVQAVAQVTVYGTELWSVNPTLDLSQVVTYTGAANFSLFVALTPGAIGIRESFLLFSRKLHHVGTHTIVAASVIDRAVFLVLLGVLFLLTLAFHARRSLKIDERQG